MTKLVWVSVFLGVCSVMRAPQAVAQSRDHGARPPSLFWRLGGIPAITAVVDGTLQRAVQDERIKARFANANMGRLRNQLIEQICSASGGPCRYQGLDMRTAHRGMGITEFEFDALLADLKAVLDQFRVPAQEQYDLLALLAPTKATIVEQIHPVATAATKGPVAERAQSLREAAGLLDRADGERGRGNRSLAEQLFSFAEMIVGVDALASLASHFRDGAPPRITTPTVPVPVQSPPQPQAVGNSEDEEPPARPARGSLTGTVQVGGVPLTGFAVVTLEPASGRFRRREPRHRTIEQRDRQFAPRVLVVPVGSTVAFPNFDSIYHNVFSLSATKPFDLGLYKAGQEREVRFDKEGVARVGCNLHANMSAIIAVVSAPYYAVTDAHGRFNFRSLPPGNFRLRVYTDGSEEPVVQNVRVQPERNTVTVTLPRVESQGVPVDKFGLPRVQKNAP